MPTLKGQSSGTNVLHIATRPRPNENGFALVSSLIGSAILAVIATAIIAYSMQIARTSRDFVADIETDFSLDAGLNRILIAYSRPGDPLRDALVPDGRSVFWDFQGRKLRLHVEAESGKLDVNTAKPTHIAGVLKRLIEQDGLRNDILAALTDARSTQQPIRSIAEILPPYQRMAATRDLLERYLTAWTGQTGVDLRTVSTLVLEATPDMSSAALNSLLRARASKDPIDLRGIEERTGITFVQQRPIYTIYCDTVSGFQKMGSMKATVAFDERQRISIFSWTRASLPRH